MICRYFVTCGKAINTYLSFWSQEYVNCKITISYLLCNLFVHFVFHTIYDYSWHRSFIGSSHVSLTVWLPLPSQSKSKVKSISSLMRERLSPLVSRLTPLYRSRLLVVPRFIITTERTKFLSSFRSYES